MNTVNCFIISDSDFLALILSLNEYKLIMISFANANAKMKAPKAKLTKHARYRDSYMPKAKCNTMATKNPNGVFQSKGSLRSLKNQFKY